MLQQALLLGSFLSHTATPLPGAASRAHSSECVGERKKARPWQVSLLWVALGLFLQSVKSCLSFLAPGQKRKLLGDNPEAGPSSLSPRPHWLTYLAFPHLLGMPTPALSTLQGDGEE